MKTRILFFTLIFLITINGFSQWIWRNPLPQGNTMQSVCTLDGQTCWAAGGFGTVMKTTDGGITWAIMNTGITNKINSICFTDDAHGWIACDGGKILKSNNGGISWDVLYQGPDDLLLFAVTFTDPMHGCAAGGINVFSVMLITWDGGISWTEFQPGEHGKIMDVSFPDFEHGWAVSLDGCIFSTNDSGQTWELLMDESFSWFEDVHFVDTLHGWVMENHDNDLYITDDGGRSWNLKHVNYAVKDIYFISTATGYMCGYAWVSSQYQAWVRKTMNGGYNWGDPQWIDANSLYALDFANEDVGWSVGSSGAIFKTLDGNQSWTHQTFSFTNKTLGDVTFLQEGALGWICANNGVMLHSTDYGITWGIQPTGATGNLHSVDFIDPMNGWSCGDYGTVLRTADGGASWDPVPVPTDGSCRSLSVLTPDKIIIVCDSGIIFRTADQGATWSASVPISQADYSSVCFPDTLHGWVVGYTYAGIEAFQARTTDGGITWITNGFNHTDFLQSVFFIDEQNGWAVGENKIIMRTTDGGSNWEIQHHPDADDLRSVFFKDEVFGIIAGDDGVLLASQNSGITWESIPSGTDEYLFSVCANSLGDVWCVGMNGCILHYPYLLTGNSGRDKIPASLNLSIHPNPFTDQATLGYSLDSEQHVRITVYSLDGRKVAAVLDDVQQKGDYRIHINCSSLQPGIYLCELKTPSRLLTGKIILVQ